MLHTMRSLAHDESGMSLAEILVACVIIAIGLVGLMSAVPTASYGIQEGVQLSTATFLANQRLEQVRNATWVATPANDCLGISASSTAAPTSASCNGAAVTTFLDESPMAAPYAGFTRTVRITNCALTSCGNVTDAELRQITVTVTYQAVTATGVGGTKSAIVSMFMAQR